jgi:MFS family permease
MSDGTQGGMKKGDRDGPPPSGHQPSQGYLDQIGAAIPTIAGAVGVWLRTTFSSLGVRNYRLFFIGQGISLVGTWVRRTAMGWLVYQLTGSKALLGLIMGLATLPMFVLSPWAGSIADRVDKRRMIVLTQVAAALCSGLIALLIFTDRITVWSLGILATASGIAFAFEIPARQAFVVEMVGRERLINAIALNSGLVNLSRIFGPALAGIVMGTIGMGFCFTIDAVSYLVVIATLVMLALPQFRPPAQLDSQWQALLEGAREVRRNRRVRVLLLLLFLVGAFGWSFQTLMPAIAPDLLRLSAARYGVLMSMFGVGAIGGALFVASRREGGSRRRQVFGGVWTMAGGIYLVALGGTLLGARPAAFWAVSAALMVTGVGAVIFMSTANTLIQTGVEDRIRGRIMGIWAVAFGGSLPLGAFLAGIVAQSLSPYLTIALFATVMLAGSLVVHRGLPPRPRPEREEDPDRLTPPRST